MHRKTRTLLCRIGLLMLCVLPTTVVGSWIVIRNFSGYVPAQTAEWQRELGLQLGLIVKLDGVSYPAPDVAQLAAVQLFAPETRQPIAAARQMRIERSAACWSVTIEGLSIEAQGLASLVQALDQLLVREQSTVQIDWHSRDVVVLNGELGQTFRAVAGQFSAGGPTHRFDCQLEPAGDAAGEPIRLQVARTWTPESPSTEWQIDTAGHSLPCATLFAAAPELSSLGASCEFRGSARFIQQAGKTHGEAAGTLQCIDLDSLVTEQFPHRLSGEATVTIDKALIGHGKLIELKGRLESSGGTLSRSLVQAAQAHLQLETAALSGEPDFASPIDYDKLAFAFELSGPWFSLAGQADSTHPGAALVCAGEARLSVPPQHAVTSASLLRMLLPDSRHLVPATEQTGAIVRLLPLPDVAPATSPEHQHTPTRLIPASHSEATVRQPVLR